MNLLENAARYTPPGTPLHVTASTDAGWLRLTVADHGRACRRAEERIFEKFYRGQPLPDIGRGSGLGLAICRAIAKVHGGNVTAAIAPRAEPNSLCDCRS